LMQAVSQSRDELQRRLERLEADNARLAEFVDNVFSLTLAAQDSNALQITLKVHQLSRKHRRIIVCPLDCRQSHSPSRWARMLNVSRKALYDWMRNGLAYQLERDGLTTRRSITHESMRDFLSRRN
jgi:hypothetical protein